MTLKFLDDELIIGGTEWTYAPFRFSKILRIGGGVSPTWQDVILSGTGSLTLVNAKADGLNYLKLFGGTQQRNLPKGHTQLNYVYMTRGSHIKIEDLPISSGYKVEYEFRTTTLSTALRNYIGGRAVGVSAGGGFRLSKLASGGSTLNRVVLYGFEDGTEYYDPTTQFQTNTKYKYTYHNGVCTLESGGSVVSTQTFTVNDDTSTNWGINAYVNGTYWQNDTDGIYVYSLKVWNTQGELVMDLVPDLTSSDVVCFYDMVTGTLRTASVGTFEAGTPIVPTPTPTAPIDIVCNNGVIKYSANMCNVNEQTALVGYYISAQGVVTEDEKNWIYQDFIPVKPNTTYTLTMSTPIYYVTISEYSTADDSGFIIRNAKQSSTSSAPYDVTFITITTDANTNYIRFGTNIDRTVVTLDRVLAINWMLNVGDTMAYQPYVEGGIYTDGTQEKVEVFGKNLFDVSTATMLHLKGASVGEALVTDAARYGYCIKVKPNTSYTVSRSDSYYLNLIGTTEYPASDVKIKQYRAMGTLANDTITINSDVNYLYIFSAYASVCGDLQIELGSTATTYESYYYGGSALAEMLLKAGDYKDVQSVLDGVVTRNCGVLVFDGTEDYWNDQISGYGRVYIMPRDINCITVTSRYTDYYCSHFNASTTTSSGNTSITSSGMFFWVQNDITTLTEWTNWLKVQYQAGTPVIVVYPLATPITESVTAQPLTIQASTNVVDITEASIDNLGLEVSYKAGVTVTITQVENAQLSNDVTVTIS